MPDTSQIFPAGKETKSRQCLGAQTVVCGRHGSIQEALFAHYRKACDWKKFKNDLISETLKPSDNDITHIEDVPIICRIVESPEDLN